MRPLGAISTFAHKARHCFTSAIGLDACKTANAPFGLKPPSPQETAPAFFTANKIPCPAPAFRLSGSTAPAQAPRPRERPRATHRTSAANQPPPSFQCTFLFHCHAAKLACDGSANRPRCPKPFSLAASASPFHPQRASFLRPLPNDGVSGTAAPSNHHGRRRYFARPTTTASPRRSRVR